MAFMQKVVNSLIGARLDFRRWLFEPLPMISILSDETLIFPERIERNYPRAIVHNQGNIRTAGRSTIGFCEGAKYRLAAIWAETNAIGRRGRCNRVLDIHSTNPNVSVVAEGVLDSLLKIAAIPNAKGDRKCLILC